MRVDKMSSIRLTRWESTTLVYLAIYSCCIQQFSCHHSYACTCLDHKLWTTWVGAVCVSMHN